MAPTIALSSVRKIYGKGGAAVDAFGPVTLDIEEGEFISFLGPSGCGKSTLMLMIAGLLTPTEGVIALNGADVRGPQTNIGIMFQDNTLVPWRTVRGNVELQLEMRGIPTVGRRERIDALLRSVFWTSPNGALTNSLAACSSAPPFAKPWCTIPRSFCSTSRSASWTR
jgi:NitT/TauT family transport system ATP-binding protein